MKKINILLHISGPDPNTLEHENLEEFEKLRSNPPFPVSDDEMDEVLIREKRDARRIKNEKVKPIKKKRKNKMDESIRDSPDFQDNSKFHGTIL